MCTIFFYCDVDMHRVTCTCLRFNDDITDKKGGGGWNGAVKQICLAKHGGRNRKCLTMCVRRGSNATSNAGPSQEKDGVHFFY